MKNIIITGASGLVATELITKLLHNTDYQLYLLSTNTNTLINRYNKYKHKVKIFTLEEFHNYIIQYNKNYDFDICIHTAFSRSSDGNLITKSLDYQKELLNILKGIKIKSFINISSQSVYGKKSTPLWSEQTDTDPDYIYAMGKYASELLTELSFKDTNINWTNIRLSSICENARFVSVFVDKAINKETIQVTAPNQYVSFIDIRDVASALIKIINNADKIKFKNVYNLGTNKINSIGEIAQITKMIGIKNHNIQDINIVEYESENYTKVGVNSTLFMNTFNWIPQYNIEDMINSLYLLKLSNDKIK
ncbi:MAG: SDR family oxidoreductase [Muribaculaceae bacterium]|nr:SDR family oxidoreductase [Muribaculaceae bacterium]